MNLCHHWRATGPQRSTSARYDMDQAAPAGRTSCGSFCSKCKAPKKGILGCILTPIYIKAIYSFTIFNTNMLLNTRIFPMCV
ncbi:hypothetical protein XENTR_v10003026 [Xenopus tropicalis]|nr:hypothetical protein XENTR_v10003026 [Xenopus tropicalis]